MVTYLATKNKAGDVAGVTVLTDGFDLESFKQQLTVNPDDKSIQVWRDGDISEITEDEYKAFLEAKSDNDEAESGVIGAEIADEDVKAILAALVSGNQDVAKKIVEKSRKKPKEDKTPPATR